MVLKELEKAKQEKLEIDKQYMELKNKMPAKKDSDRKNVGAKSEINELKEKYDEIQQSLKDERNKSVQLEKEVKTITQKLHDALKKLESLKNQPPSANIHVPSPPRGNIRGPPRNLISVPSNSNIPPQGNIPFPPRLATLLETPILYFHLQVVSVWSESATGV